jgi:hypothetical protein
MRKFLVLFLLGFVAATPISAQVVIPNTFVAGTTASAAQVNANFSALGAAALNRAGGTVTGNIAVDDGFTLDGVDLSAMLSGGNFVGATLALTSTTTPQLTVSYDGSNLMTLSVSSVGGVTFDATGAGAGFSFSDNVAIGTLSLTTLSCTGCVDSTQLAATTVSAASYGSASSVATFTVDADGRLTTAASTAIVIAETAITDGSLLARVGSPESITQSWSFAQQILVSGGSDSAPSIGFIGDTNTGLFSEGPDRVCLSVGAASAFCINNSGGNVSYLAPEGDPKWAMNMKPVLTNTYTLGDTDARWAEAWVTSGSLTTSDRRMKKNIVPTTLGLVFIDKLKPIEYNWSDPKLPKGKFYGFIAQDLQELGFAGVDSRNPKELGLRYTELLGPMVKAIQELHIQVQGAYRLIALQQDQLNTLNEKVNKMRQLRERRAE